LKVDHFEQGCTSSDIPPWGADSINKTREAEKTTGGRGSPVVRNLPLLSIQTTSVGASDSGTPPQGANGSSTLVESEPVVVAFHHGGLVFTGNLWILSLILAHHHREVAVPADP
jgi:hypothetical protein